jgi:hypothetical protein
MSISGSSVSIDLGSCKGKKMFGKYLRNNPGKKIEEFKEEDGIILKMQGKQLWALVEALSLLKTTLANILFLTSLAAVALPKYPFLLESFVTEKLQLST